MQPAEPPTETTAETTAEATAETTAETTAAPERQSSTTACGPVRDPSRDPVEPETAFDVSIVLPTYCEAASLPLLVPRLVTTLEHAGLASEVIVVDDASPDGTAAAAHDLATRHRLHVVERHGERSLARAVLEGFSRARGEVCVVMDADGSHPVDAVPALVEAVRSGRAEIAVGSRLAPGGGFRGWPLWGRLKSRFAALFARGLAPLSDPTTGMMAVRRALLDELELDPVGWKIVLEVVVKAAPRPVVEVPIVFGPRLAGRSKQSLGVFGQYLRHCWRLWTERSRRVDARTVDPPTRHADGGRR